MRSRAQSEPLSRLSRLDASRARVWCLLLAQVLLHTSALFSQSESDRLIATLGEATGQARLEILVDLTTALSEEDARQAALYGDEALELLRSLPEAERELELLNSLAYAKNVLSDFPTARALASQAEELATAQHDTQALARALRNIGRSHRSTGEYASALNRYREAGRLFEEVGDHRGMGDTLNDTGITLWMLADYPAALEAFQRSHDRYQRLDDHRRVAATVNNIGMLYRKMERPQKALEYYQRALEIRQRLGPPGALANVLHNLGNIHTDLGEYEQAREKYRSALEIGPTDASGRANTLESLCSTHQRLGALRQAATCYRDVLDLRQKHGNQAGLASTLIKLAMVTRQQGEPAAALEMLEEARELTSGINARPELQDALNELAETFAQMERYREAFGVRKEYEAVRASIFNAENIREIDSIEQRFEAERAAREIETLKQQRVISDLELKHQGATRRVLVVSFASLILIGLLLFNRYRLGIERAAIEREAAGQREVSHRLKEMAHMKDEFLANTSHELRTPLHGIIGLAESLNAGATGPLAEETRRHLRLIATNGHRLRHLVENLLDLSELRHQSLTLDRSSIDFRSLAEVELTILGPLAESKNLRLVNAVNKALPPVHADERRLRQILHNLLSNAIKFTDAGTITVTAEHRDDLLDCRVEDTGSGIPPADRENLFKVLEQAQDLPLVHGPGGLGLAITRQLVKLHGGEIAVESTVGRGSTFSFTLPLSGGPLARVLNPPSEPPPTTSREPPEPGAKAAVAYGVAECDNAEEARPLILIVDDEPTNLLVLESYLAPQGYRLLQASGGQEGLRLACQHRPDLILLDIMMPTMLGYEVCRKLRRIHSAQSLPILFLTAKSQLTDMVEGFRCGANDYLIKPVRQDELLARVGIHLALLASHQNLERLVEEKAAELKILRGLLPICSICKMIRDEEGTWTQLETYLDFNTEASFSHSLCPECAASQIAALDRPAHG